MEGLEIVAGVLFGMNAFLVIGYLQNKGQIRKIREDVEQMKETVSKSTENIREQKITRIAVPAMHGDDKVAQGQATKIEQIEEEQGCQEKEREKEALINEVLSEVFS